jgi:hypothetical protein
MGRAWRWVAPVSCAAMAGVLFGCPLKKQASDAGTDAEAGAAVEPEAAAAQLAANESDVTRYPDEKAGNRTPVTTEATVNLRTQAGAAGDLVVVLKKGTEVDKVAEHGGSYLVLADDPKDSSRKLMGWVSEGAFGEPVRRVVSDAGKAAADGGTTPPVADAGKAAKPLDVKKNADGSCPAGYAACSAMCRLSCKADADCALATAHCTGGFCMGPGAVACK